MPIGNRTPYAGPGTADTRLSLNWQRAGQISPQQRSRLMGQEGRYLSGFGSFGDATSPSGPGGDPDTAEPAVRQLEEDDDTFGSGVFDQPGAGPTANANLGVFASSYSLPGYLAREVPFAVSKDEFDATSDAPIVTIPSGGLPLIGSSAVVPRAGTARTDTYVSIPTRQLPSGDDRALPSPDYRRVPSDPGNSFIRPIPQSRGVVAPSSVAMTPVPRRLSAAPLAQRAVPIARRAPAPVISGLGAVGGTSLLEYAVAGAIVGAAGYWLWRSVKGEMSRGDRRRRAWAELP